MIHVEPAPEPPMFEIGETGWVERTGPKRKQLVVRGMPVTRVEDIPVEKLPTYWTRALPDMCESYNRICAYVCVYIEPVAGSPTIDHWIPKSSDRRKAYEWHNFRLACSAMNTAKATATGLVDPFTVVDGWFALEFVDFEVVPGVEPAHPQFAAIERTIEPAGLNLNRYECRKLREDLRKITESLGVGARP